MSSRTVRNLVKELNKNNNLDYDLLNHFSENSEYDKIRKVFDKIIISLRIVNKKLATMTEAVEDNWILYDTLMRHKHMLHEQIDILIKEKRKYKKYCRA